MALNRTRLRTAAAAAGAATALAMVAGALPAQAAASRTVTGLTTTGAEWTFPAGQTGISDIAKSIRADVAYQQGYTGKGVGVALIDTGVAPVPGLTSGNIVNGPDLSLESQVPSLLHKDGYGHGTHMAGIIAGRDNTSGTGFRGIAPDAKLTSIKVGMSNGAVDVSQMLAAIDWVVKHRNDDPKNPIRVLNLSYGTDSTLGQATNPLALAVENAWWAGIAVVVAAGNTGHAFTVPATDMHPIVVGSTDPLGTTNPADDALSSFTSWQGRTWPIDVLVPGRSVVSLRDPGSYADTYYPSARVGDRYFKGSGTSQAAAVVSGAIALILQKYPNATPWQIRSQFWDSSTPLPKATVAQRGELNLTNIFNGGVGTGWQTTTRGTGDGSLQAARGTSIVTSGPQGTALTGENDIFGPFSTAAWAKASTAGTSWNGGSWMGLPWTGASWGAATDNQANWSGTSWAGRAWSGRAWSDVAWSGRAWSGRAWSGDGFTGAAWSGVSWSGALWL
ncbi:MAG: serine protease AprX [Cryptosporangiaceae bacterium]|nr:serine protease AprX [Cryptosporangiaceae bacterium]